MKRTRSQPAIAETHPIAVVAARTGLSQDVLRAWERRYGVVHPDRGPGGQRRYTDADIERLQLLRDATAGGHSISQISGLSARALAKLVADDEAARARQGRVAGAAPEAAEQREALLALARAMDATALDVELRRAAATLGIAGFLDTVAAPLLRDVGEEWHAGRLTTAHEHLVSSVVHDVVAGVMRAFAPEAGAPALVAATPAGERHAVGALLAAAAAAVEGWRVLYLGADLPAEEIARAASGAGVRVVGVSIVYVDERRRVLHELRTLRHALPASIRLIAGGAGASALATELGALDVRVLSSIAELSAELRRERRHH